jgi:hypothetical protein
LLEPSPRFKAIELEARVDAETAGVKFEPVASMKGVEQLDLLDGTNTIVLSRSSAGALDLQVVALP